MAALCYAAFAFLKIPIPTPGGGMVALHIGNAFCVLAALYLGGVYGGLAGAIGMTIADLMDPKYVTSAPKTFLLKFLIGLIAGFIAHKLGHITEDHEDYGDLGGRCDRNQLGRGHRGCGHRLCGAASGFKESGTVLLLGVKTCGASKQCIGG